MYRSVAATDDPSDRSSQTHSAESDTLETVSGLKLLSFPFYSFEKSHLMALNIATK